jgi:hypothetical protein
VVRLVAPARTRFNRLLARKVDPKDVVPSAFKGFFVSHREGKLHAGDWEGLWDLPTLITSRKCADRARFFLADRRDVARELTGPVGGDELNAWLVALDRQPRPEEAAILAETVERLFRDLSDHERCRRHPGTEPPGLYRLADHRPSQPGRPLGPPSPRADPQAARAPARGGLIRRRNRRWTALPPRPAAPGTSSRT